MYRPSHYTCVPSSPSARSRSLYASLALFACLVAFGSAADAATFTVTTTSDTGAGSLRAAVAAAAASAGADTINFAIPAASCDAVTGKCTITLASEIVIDATGGALTINGTGAHLLTIDAGPGTNRIFYSFSGATLTLTGMTLTGGNGVGERRAVFGSRRSDLSAGQHARARRGARHWKLGARRWRRLPLPGNQPPDIQFDLLLQHVRKLRGVHDGQYRDRRGQYDRFREHREFERRRRLRQRLRERNVAQPDDCLQHSRLRGGGIYHQAGATRMGSSIVAANTSPDGPDIRLDAGSIISAGYNLIGTNTTVEVRFPAGNPNAANDIVGTSAGPISPTWGLSRITAAPGASPPAAC